jgi:tellurium resistance protein TerD
MSKLSLPLKKDGVAGMKLSLNLSKGGKFMAELAWDSPHDLDANALLCVNDGSGAKIDTLEKVLSVFNLNTVGGALKRNADGSFGTPCGALLHSGDKRDGRSQGVDEVITIDTSRVAPEVNEIPIFVTIYDKSGRNVTFTEVKEASITIKDEAGKVLGSFGLTNEFGAFNCVQMGSMIRNATGGWDYAAVGSGFVGDFNTILGFFS